MKKIMILAMLAILSLGASAQKAYPKQVEIAKCYAKQAQEKFKLTAEQQDQVFEIKKAEFSTVNAAVKPMKVAGKSKEEIQATTKGLKKSTYEELAELFGCTKKELNTFNKEFQTKMKAKAKK